MNTANLHFTEFDFGIFGALFKADAIVRDLLVRYVAKKTSRTLREGSQHGVRK